MNRIVRFMEYFEIPREEARSLSEGFLELLKHLKMDESALESSLARWEEIPYDIHFDGVRRFLGLVIREAVALAGVSKLREEGVKIVYASVPLPLPILHALRSAGNGRIFASTPDMVLTTFERMILFTENTREYNYDVGWNPSCRHCLLNGSRFVYVKRGILSPPDLYIGASAVCDEAGKMDEMIKMQTGLDWDTVLLKLPGDFESPGAYENSIAYLKAGISEVFKTAEKWGISVDEKCIEDSLAWWRRLSMQVYGLNFYVSKASLQPMGGAALALVSSGLVMFMDTGSDCLAGVLKNLSRELKKAVRENRGILPEGSPKVGFYFMPYLYPEIEEVFRKNNVATVFSAVFASVLPDESGIEAVDGIESLAKLWMRLSMAAGLKTESVALISTIKRLKPSAMVFGFLDFDRRMGIHSKMLAAKTTKECGIPAWLLSGDFWNPDSMNTFIVKDRLESLCNVIKR